MFENRYFMVTFGVLLVFISYPTDAIFWNNIVEYNTKFVIYHIFDMSVVAFLIRGQYSLIKKNIYIIVSLVLYVNFDQTKARYRHILLVWTISQRCVYICSTYDFKTA